MVFLPFLTFPNDVVYYIVCFQKAIHTLLLHVIPFLACSLLFDFMYRERGSNPYGLSPKNFKFFMSTDSIISAPD